MERWGLALALLALAAPCAQGQDLEVSLIQRRGLQLIQGRGAAPSQGGPLVARIRLGNRTALSAPVRIADGKVEIEVLTSRLLLPGRYALEVAPVAEDSEPVLSGELQVGSAEEARASRARQQAWLERAASTLRWLSSHLDRRGAFTAAWITQDPEAAVQALEHFQSWLEQWRATLRTARMDLATYEQRVLLPANPEAGEAMRALFPLLEARLTAWTLLFQATAEQRPGTAPSLGELEGAVGPILASLGRDASRIQHWTGGPLGELPPVTSVLSAKGGYVSPLGFRFQAPDGYTVVRPTSGVPRDRLVFRGDGVWGVVQVSEFPDANTADVLSKETEVMNWESFLGYKRLKSERTQSGLRIEFEARFGKLDGSKALDRVRIVQKVLFPKEGGRVMALLVVRGQDVKAPASLAKLEAGFELSQ